MADESPPHKFPVVALGASAGGLAALKTFFRQVEPDSGLASS
jgi:chemotaxis response regulator CheB